MITFVGGRKIYTMDDDGENIKCLTHSDVNHGMIFNVDWSPDRTMPGFTLQEKPLSPYHRVCTFDIKSNVLTYLTPPGQINYFGQWLADGSILYTERTMKPSESDQYLCMMQKDGSDQRRIFHCYAYRGVTYSSEMDNYQIAAISPEANIVLISLRDQQIYMLQPGGDPVLIESEGLKVQSAVWAADGTRFAYSAARSLTSRFPKLYVAHADGTNRKEIGRVLAESGFSWSPDGKNIGCIGMNNAGFTINVIELERGKSRTITNIEVNPKSGDLPGAPEWSPDSRCFLYATYVHPYMQIYRTELDSGHTNVLVDSVGEFQYISNLIWH